MTSLADYAIVGSLGSGGMGRVWRARHRRLGTPVAIKVLHDDLAAPEQHLLLRHEVAASAALDHPAIIQPIDFGTVSREEATELQGAVAGAPFLVLELVDGVPLSRRLPLDWSAALPLLIELADALAHAHARRVIHRDVKPSNVLLARSGARVRLTDFGLAHLRRAPPFLPGHGAIGFTAPEQRAGDLWALGPWTDVWGVGAVAFACLMGRGPKETDDTFETPAPPAARSVLERALAPRPIDRYQSAAELRDALSALGGSARHPTPARWKVDRQRPGLGMGLYGLRLPELVGRQPERTALLSALDATARARRSAVVVIHGVAGVGKSRLAQWIAEQAVVAHGALVLDAAYASESGPADGVFGALTRELSCTDLPADALLARCRARIPDPAVDLRGLAAALLAHAGKPAPDGWPRSRSPREAVAACLEGIVRLASGRPAALLLDDGHLGYEATHIAQHLLDLPDEGHPLLVVVTARDDAQGPRAEAIRALADRADVIDLPLEALPASDWPRLVRGILQVEGPLAAEIETRAAGNPAFAVQLVAELVSRRTLEATTAGYRLRAGATVTLPADLLTTWRVRIDEALRDRRPADRHALELAAALGRGATSAEWHEACGVAGVTPADDLVASLVGRGLLRPTLLHTHEACRFSHGMVREVLLTHAGRQHRLVQHHVACATALERLGTHPERLGRHLQLAGAYSAAIEPLLAGARKLLTAGDAARAEELLRMREEAMRRAGVPESDERWGRGWVAAVRAAFRQGRLEAAHALQTRAEHAANAEGWDELLPEVLSAGAQLARCCGNISMCETKARAGLEAAGRVSHRWAEADCLSALADVLRRTGRSVEGADCAAAAARTFDELGLSDEAGYALLRQSYVSRRHLPLEARRPLVLEAHRRFLADGCRPGLVGVSVCLGEMARQAGELEEAVAHFEEAIRIARSVGQDPMVPRLNQAVVLVEQGRFHEAEAMLQVFIEHLDRHGRSGLAAGARAFLLPCVAARADWVRFDELMIEAEELLRESGFADVDIVLAYERAAELTLDACRSRAQRAARQAIAQCRTLGLDARARHLAERYLRSARV